MAEAANVLANFFFHICVHRMMIGRTGTSRGTKKTKRNKKTNVEKKTRETWPDY